jgi:hypothetical protein
LRPILPGASLSDSLVQALAGLFEPKGKGSDMKLDALDAVYISLGFYGRDVS